MNKLFTKALGLAAAGAIIVPAALAVTSPERLGLNASNAASMPQKAESQTITPPYNEDFSKLNDVRGLGYTIIDMNTADGTHPEQMSSKWTYDFNGIQYDCLICPGMYYADGRGNPVDMDDWIFTPGIKLEKGTKYIYTAKLGAYLPADIEKAEVYIGQSPTVNAMTTNLIPTTEITGVRYSDRTYKTLTKEFTVPADGTYYIGVHGCTPNASIGYKGFLLCFWGWNIDAGVKEGAPAKVSDLKIAAGTDGSKKVDISFTTPLKTLGGTTMNALTKAVIERDGTVVKEFPTPAVGTPLTFSDDNVTEGAHTYTIYAVNTVGNGDRSINDVFVGTNVPGKVENLKAELTSTPGEVKLTWDAPKYDVDGYPTNEGTVSYTIYELTEENNLQVAKDITATTYTYAVCKPEDAQRFNSWYVEAVSSKGKSGVVETIKIPVGADMTLPFAESFSGYKFHNAFIQNSLLNGDKISDGTWSFISTFVEPQDNDGGLITMQGRRVGDSAELVSGRIYMDPTITNPSLTFYYQGLAEINTSGLTVYVKEAGENDWTEVHDVEFSGPYWHKETVDLKNYVGKTIQIRFVGIVGNQASVPLDNIRIGALFDKNLTAGLLTVPEELSFNTSIPLTLQVENTGKEETGNFTVDFFRNGEKLRTVNMTNLQPDETTTALCTDRLSVDDPQNIEYYAVINYADDQFAGDNRSNTAKCILKINNFPVPTITSARMYEDGVNNKGEKNFENVKVKWETPVADGIEPTSVMENFEDASGLATEIPGWTMYDQDGRRHQGIAQLTFGTIVEGASSFFVSDVEELAYARPFQPVSGDKVLSSLVVYDSATGSKQSDDWAVLPALSGKAQTISFYARSYSIGALESFEVLTSTTGKEVKDFTKLAEKTDIDPYWTKFEFDVPEGTKYFAIRCTSNNKQLLLIDDVTYTPSYSEGLPLMGYNVYCDDTKVNKTLVTDNYFIHKGGTQGKKYTVSAVYYKGESKPSKEFISNMDSIEDINADTLGGVTVNGNTINVVAEGNVEVYSIDGKVVFRGVANPSVSVAVENGIYVVKAGRETRKVVVR